MHTKTRPRERQQEFVDPHYVARLLDVNVDQVRSWMRKGWLEFQQLPRGRRISRQALERFLADQPWLSED